LVDQARKEKKYCTGGQPPSRAREEEPLARLEALKPGALCDVYTLVGVHVRIEQASS